MNLDKRDIWNVAKTWGLTRRRDMSATSDCGSPIHSLHSLLALCDCDDSQREVLRHGACVFLSLGVYRLLAATVA
jgi:hypothetical protein